MGDGPTDTTARGTRPAGAEPPPTGRDFIRAIIERDLSRGTYDGRVVTRFPPEPNGYLHIGHAKAIVLNFGIAGDYSGARCHLRFDDTNPTTEDPEYVDAIQRDVKWLGYDWGKHLYFASDYFGRMFDFAEELIRKGLAYVDSQSEAEIREHRGTVSVPGTPSPYRDRTVDENLDLFRRMRAGEFPDGAHVLRASIDMSSPNMLMRDPLIYRIRHAHHYRTGDDWCIYPLYDYAHPLEDAIECVTHSLCTLEFENNRELYDWVVDNTSVPCRPRQYEFARLNLDYTVMSKRKLLALVREGRVDGWDDPRMPTIAGLRRRGVTPEAIRAFCEMVGVAKADSRIDMGKLEFAIRDDLNRRAPRVLCVLRPLRVVITNYPEDRTETLDAPYWPRDVPREGSRPLPFSRVIYIERDDFMEDPPADYYRLAPGREVRLRYAYLIRCDEVVKDEDGRIAELRCTYDPETRGGRAPDGRRVRGTIHWVSAKHSLPCEVRLYDRLFTVPDPEDPEAAAELVHPPGNRRGVAASRAEEQPQPEPPATDFRRFLNADSLVVLPDARVEPGVADDPPGSRYQFERQGYFISDPEDSAPGALVFNRTVTLRDGWVKATRMARPGGGVRAGARKHAPEPRVGRAGEEGLESGAGAAAPADARMPELTGSPEPSGGGAGGDTEHEARLSGRREEPPADRQQRIARYTSDLGLDATDAEIITRDAATASLFDSALESGASPRAVANWLIHELPRETRGRAPDELPFGGMQLGWLVRLVEDGEVSSSAAREVLAELAEQGGDPSEIVDRRGLRQIDDPASLETVIDEVIAANPAKSEAYRTGKTGLLGFFMGQVMRRTDGRANPGLAKRILEAKLSNG